MAAISMDDLLVGFLEKLQGVTVYGKPHNGWVTGSSSGWHGWIGDVIICADPKTHELIGGDIVSDFKRYISNSKNSSPIYALAISNDDVGLITEEMRSKFWAKSIEVGFSDGFLTTFDEIFDSDEVASKMPRPRSLIEIDEISEGLARLREIVATANFASLGHNGPPEAIAPPPISIGDVDEAIQAANIYRTIISEEAENSSQMGINACENIFSEFRKKLGSFLVWLKMFPLEMWVSFVSKAPEWAMKGLITAVAIEAVEKMAMLLQQN